MDPIVVVEQPLRPGRSREAAVSVAQVNTMVDRVLRQRVPSLWIMGEVSNWKRYSSGSAFFTLKDATSQMKCVMFRSELARLPIEPEDGMKVLVQGQVGIYGARGDFQLSATHLELSEEGGLWKIAFERLKQQLEKEGLLDPSRKRRLPAIPRTVGVVTSPSGAALHDILHVLRRRAPWVRVLFSPARVQGEGSASDVANALALLERQGECDVVIVGRGGGSIEDLWAFNEEHLARAIASCSIPVVSAVGHETDFTISDFVADVRAPTPSAAAERVVPDGKELFRNVENAPERLANCLLRLSERKQEIILSQWERMGRAMENRTRSAEQNSMRLTGKLEALSPLAALARGYAVLSDEAGHLVRSATSLKPGQMLRTRLTDGIVESRIEQIHPLAEDK